MVVTRVPGRPPLQSSNPVPDAALAQGRSGSSQHRGVVLAELRQEAAVSSVRRHPGVNHTGNLAAKAKALRRKRKYSVNVPTPPTSISRMSVNKKMFLLSSFFCFLAE